MAKKIDIEGLREVIKGMNRRQKLYKLLKKELSALGYWRNRPRGKPSADNFKGKSVV